MMEMLTNLVTQSGVSATQLSAILLGVLFLIMIIGLATGQELAFVLGGAGVIIGYLAWGGPGITIAMTKVYDQMQSYSMVAIPMFVLMANFLTHSKVADGLFLSIRYLLGPLKGGLGLAVIVVSTVFAATTGIVGASVVTMGMLSVPVLLKCGYKPSLACGMVCAGGSLGILIPPSIMLVSMGSYANVSVGKIFFAAIVPGLVLSLFYMIYVFVICHIHPDYGPAMTTEELAAMPLRERITGSLVNLIPPVILIVGVLGYLYRLGNSDRGGRRWRTVLAYSRNFLQAVQLQNAVRFADRHRKDLCDGIHHPVRRVCLHRHLHVARWRPTDRNLDFERWHRQMGRVRNHDGDRIRYGHVPRLAGYRYDRVPDLPADYGYVRL